MGVPSVIFGSLAFATVFLTGQPWIWAAGLAASALSAPAVAALQVYGPELFPTRIRSAANTLVTAMGVAGSATGLVLAGQLSNRWGIGNAIALLVVGPLVAAVVIALLFPETARQELEVTSGEAPSQSP